MGVVEATLVLLSSFACIYLLLVLIKFLQKTWWIPIHIGRVMSSQGIKGPPYRFLHGNTKEILRMRAESFSKPMNLSSHYIFPRIQPHLITWLSLYGKTILTWHGPRAVLVITEPEFAKEILNDREKVYPKIEADFYLKKQLGDGLVTSKGEKWAKLRKVANHAFHVESLKNMVPAIIESVEMMLETWKQHESEEIEVFKEFKVLSSEIISRTAFGSSYVEGKSIFDMSSKLTLLSHRNLLKIRLPGTSLFWKSSDEIESEKLEQGVRDSILGIIKRREKGMTEENDFGSDLLGQLMKANKNTDEKNRITIQDVIDECKTFYIAGHETTATLLAWAVLLLAIHTEWQEEARKEVLELFGQKPPNAEGLTRMKKISMIINETLRLYPPSLNIERKVEQDIRLGNLFLPVNISVNVSIMALHCDPKIWGEDAHCFNPERFAEGVSKATNNHPGAYLPFGLGPRICVGLNFTGNEAKIALSMILQRYSLSLSPAYIHSPIQMLTVRPQHGIQIILHAL